MELVSTSLYILLAVLTSSVVAQFLPKLPVSFVQIGLGIVLMMLPISLELDFDPDFFLIFFIAPLLYWDAILADKEALWRQRRPVLAFAIGLCIVIVVVVGAFIHLLIPSIPLALAFALAAALAPTDAVAVSSINQRSNMPDSQKSLLEGELLLNDASGVVSFKMALAALVTGTFSIWEASASLAWTFIAGVVVGILFALVKGLLVTLVRRGGLEDVTFHVLVQLLTPFAAYLLAEACGASGILAVVAAGIVDALSSKSMAPSAARLNIVSRSVWRVISFTLNGVVFVILGMLLPQAVERTWAGATPNTSLIEYVLLITLVLVLVRFVWCLVYARLQRHPDGHRHRLDRDAVMQAALITLAGAKGAVTLSICLSIPRFIGAGQVLQERELVIFLGAGVVLATLLLAHVGIVLLSPKQTVERSQAEETKACAQILRNVIESISRDETIEDKRALRRVIASYEARIDRLKGVSSYEDPQEIALRALAIGWETMETNEQMKKGNIVPIVGYGYLIELERRLSRLHHRGEFMWFLRNITGWFGMMRSAGFKGWGVTPEVRRMRHEARDMLRLECADCVLRKLAQLTPDDGYPTQTVSRVSLDYHRMAAIAASGRLRSNRLVRSSQTCETMRVALQVERDEITRAFKAELISRDTAHSLRDNVAAIEYDLEDSE